MADPRFFRVAGPFALAELARIAGAELADGDPHRLIRDVAPLDAAGHDDISFIDNRKYVDVFAASRAGAVIAHPDVRSRAPAGAALLLTRQPYRGYALVAQAFYPEPQPEGDIAATAAVHPTARIGEGTSVGHHAVIGADVEIGRHCRIEPNSVIAAGVVLGDRVTVGANASLSHCRIGSRVRIYPGVRIGQDGFGFAPDPRGHVKVPQLGRVIIGDDVEIGANTTIDRGSGPDTVIGSGAMIDNLVQIGHNVVLGRGCVLVAQVGISGSTRLGDFVMVGGQAGFAGHLDIGSGARIAAKAGVTRNVAAGEEVSGFPAVPMRQWLRQSAVLKRMGEKKNG